jgi:hypothetical protein
MSTDGEGIYLALHVHASNQGKGRGDTGREGINYGLILTKCIL